MNYIVVGFCFCILISSVSAAPSPQGNHQDSIRGGQLTLNQTRDEIAALPASSDVAAARTAITRESSSLIQNTTRPHSTFYRQASAQRDVYDYPAAGPPRNGANQSFYRRPRNTAVARLTNQMSFGANTSTGNFGPRVASNYQAPVYNLNPYANLVARPTIKTNSRSPVEQQRSSTLSSRQSTAPATQFSTAQQAQAQAIQLARLAQLQQAQVRQTLAQAQQAQARATQIAQASQPTVAYWQSVYQQSTLGLGSSQPRVARNYRTVAYSPTQAAFQAPTLGSNANNGQYLPPLNIQLPGQPCLPAGGQVCCPPNYQFQPGVGVPTYSSRSYVPLFKLQNMPAGTYLGQGIIGQPTAYVDGQSVRNLLRYISP